MRILLSGLLGLILGFAAVSYYIGYQKATKPALYSNGQCLVYSDTIEAPNMRDAWFEVINPQDNNTYKLRGYRNSWSGPSPELFMPRDFVETNFILIDCPRQPIPGE